MARVVMRLEIEADALTDAIDQIRAIHSALSSRHGEQYRALERRIEAVTESCSRPQVDTIGDRAILHAPEEITAILVEARGLGLIR